MFHEVAHVILRIRTLVCKRTRNSGDEVSSHLVLVLVLVLALALALGLVPVLVLFPAVVLCFWCFSF